MPQVGSWQLEVSMVHQLVSNKALANRIGYDVTVLGGIRPLEDRLASIEAVTIEDVRRVAQTYLEDDGRSIVHVIPPPEPDPSPEGAS